MITVVCVYNDRTVLDALLVASLRRQEVACDLVCIDNTDGRHGCAADVLNEAGCGAVNDLVMFVHQDVELLSHTWLADAEKCAKALGTGASAGVAGKDDDGVLWASVWHGEPPRFAGGRGVASPTAVQTLDGCLLLVARDDFRTTRFDPDACRGWHLYVAEYCLSRRRQGWRTFVLPLPVYHRSTGPGDASVWTGTARAIVAKHQWHTPRISTPIGDLTPPPATSRWRARARRLLRGR